MKTQEMQIGKKVYFWTKYACDEVPTIRSGVVVGGYKEASTIYGYRFQIESAGNLYERRACNCYASLEDVRASLEELLIEGVNDD